MRYVSLFSGIEAASVAWEPLGWEPVAFAEIEPFCCELLSTRFPSVPNLGDVSDIDWSELRGSVELVVGGSPCQAFSTAGKRQGLLDPRGRLMLEYIRAIHDLSPRWLLWENVPGVLSQSGGDAFETLQRELAGCGYTLAWRVIDAQFTRVAQRRRRVFLVGHFGDRGGYPSAVLFERQSMRWDTASSRAKRQALAKSAQRCPGTSSYAINTAHTKQNGTPISIELAHTLDCAQAEAVAVIKDSALDEPSKTRQQSYLCMTGTQSDAAIDDDMCGTLTASSHKDGPVLCVTSDEGDELPDDDVIRRLTPIECERLQGFPDGWTDLGGTPDAPRYRALGNSMAVPVMRWIGERIQLVDSTTHGAGTIH